MVRKDLDNTAEKERISREMGKIIYQLSEDELTELLEDEEIIINMPNDQNYLWSEEDQMQDSKTFDFKKIKAIKNVLWIFLLRINSYSSLATRIFYSPQK
mgnify:CR=1 FL=1